MSEPTLVERLEKADVAMVVFGEALDIEYPRADLFAEAAARIEELEAIVEKLPDKVADRLFKGGFDGEAQRLAMEYAGQSFDASGWCKSSVVEQVREAIAEASAKPGETHDTHQPSPQDSSVPGAGFVPSAGRPGASSEIPPDLLASIAALAPFVNASDYAGVADHHAVMHDGGRYITAGQVRAIKAAMSKVEAPIDG